MLVRQRAQRVGADERHEPLQVLRSLKTLGPLEPLEVPLAKRDGPALFDVAQRKDVEELLFLRRGGVEQGQCRADDVGSIERDQQLTQQLTLGPRDEILIITVQLV